MNKAFISYSHQDKRWADWLHRSLETYRIPKKIISKLGLESNRATPIFKDSEELASSGSLSDSVRTSLAESESLIEREMVEAQVAASTVAYLPVAMENSAEAGPAREIYERSLSTGDNIKRFLKTIHKTW